MLRVIKTTSPQHFRSATVDHIMRIIAAAFDDHGSCIVGLSGGRTPRPIYEELGVRLAHRSTRREGGCQPLGDNLHFFLVDERYVPASHPESNQRLVRETLPKNLTFPEKNLTFPNTTLPIDACIVDYTRRLKELWKNRLPALVILGMGTDGHTASLFPPLSDLALSDEHLILHTQAPKGVCCSPAARDRITLSLNALCAANEQILLLQGEEKRQTWEEMIASTENERRWPLKRIIETGRLTVFAE